MLLQILSLFQDRKLLIGVAHKHATGSSQIEWDFGKSYLFKLLQIKDKFSFCS
jgi:hypothetical protein